MQKETSIWQITKARFWARKSARRSWRVLVVLVILALLADLIAHERPIYCQYEGETHFPIFREYAEEWGLLERDGEMYRMDWLNQDFEKVVRPLVPYSPHTIDRKNTRYKSPFGQQDVRSWRYRHWLGTDKQGRDVLAGLVHGIRIALLVGLITMGIASLLGLLLGGVAGYFGDTRWKMSRVRLCWNLLALAGWLFVLFVARSHEIQTALAEGNMLKELLLLLGIGLFLGMLSNGLAWCFERVGLGTKKVSIPLDLMVMRLIEIVNSVPAMLLLLAIIGILRKPSLWIILSVIGLISWTGVARFTRAEMLRIRELDYIKATQVMGFSSFRTLFRHALPNALTPVLITISFGIAGAILLESTLAFLNIGDGGVSWGTMLSEARLRVSAWWLAIFPGLAIFVTVTIFNLIGDALSEIR